MGAELPHRYLVVIDSERPLGKGELAEFIEGSEDWDGELEVVGLRELEKRATNKLAAAVGRMSRFIDALEALTDDS